MSAKITVAMVGDYPVGGQSIRGGVQAVVSYLVDAMKARNDVDLHVITFKRHIRQPATIDAGGFHVHQLPTQRLGLTTLFWRDRRMLHACLDKIKPDIVHAQGAGRDGYLATKSGLPSVVTFHGILGQDAKYVNGWLRRQRSVMQSHLTETFCVRHAANVISISPYVQQYYGTSLRGNTFYIPNPVKADYFNVVRQEEEGRVLFAGRVIPRKGVADLVEAVAAVRSQTPIKVVLAGALDNTEYVTEVKSLIARLGLSDRFIFKGLLNESEVLDEFCRCALLVLPSYQETAPMVVQQAMASRVPVIATRICGVPDQVTHGVTGLLYEPHDVKTLATHLEMLLKNKELRANMSLMAQQKAEYEYRSEKVAERTVAMYQEILGRSRLAPSDSLG
ncbi:hypothetical protein MNBD_GAMMA24-924 [hydrothermal vent metagenome]|uniref:Glycosyltransferase n=1 Tax=hydrothermal vent metagenome TaxID=652676 RepID=A0A3B1BN37_9ZZZZ